MSKTTRLIMAEGGVSRAGNSYVCTANPQIKEFTAGWLCKFCCQHPPI